jgi:hypothetical protein
MENLEFKNAINSYVDIEIKRLEFIRNFVAPTFNKLNFNLSQIENQKENLIEELEKNKIDKTSSVLYYITLETEEKIKNISAKINAFKKKHTKNKKSYIALPKVNYDEFQNEHNCIYVGKTNSNFISRFEYHLGITKGKTTFALHLNEWNEILKPKTDLIFTLYYSTINLNEKIHYLELIESSLHNHLKPILGRESH